MTPITPEQIAYAHRLYEKGYSLQELARTLGVTVEELRQAFTEAFGAL